MGSVKRFVTVVAVVYLLLAVLFYLVPAVRTTVAEWGSGYSPTENERNFYEVLGIIGTAVLALVVVVESIDSATLRRDVRQQDGKINELKAKLYDHHNTQVPPPATSEPAVSYPTAAEAATAQPRSEAPLQ